MSSSKEFIIKWQASVLIVVGLLIAQFIAPLYTAHVAAVSPNVALVRLDRLAKGTATKGLVCVEPSVAGDAEAKLAVTFPAGFLLGSSANWTTSAATTTGWPSGAIAYPSISSGTASGQTVTFTSADLTSASQEYCFNWTTAAALTNPSTTGQYAIAVTTQNSGGTTLETNTATTGILDNSSGGTCGAQNCDQIQVTATVNENFAFSLGSNAAALGTLSASGPTSATALNASVTTNAKNGWQIWIADSGIAIGLNSTSAGKTIAYSPAVNTAAAALTTGNEGYNVGAGNHTGTCNGSFTYDPNFDDSASTAYKGGGLDATLRTLASATSTASGCAIPLTVSASISNTTPYATDYTGTMTVIAAGRF